MMSTKTRMGAMPFKDPTKMEPSRPMTGMFGNSRPSARPMTRPMRIRRMAFMSFHFWTTVLSAFTVKPTFAKCIVVLSYHTLHCFYRKNRNSRTAPR